MVDFKFMGEKLRFYLSLGLFSSFDVDAGTKLLLKTLAQQNIIPPEGKILDAGCGAGIIAVSLKKKFPGTKVTASDRNGLALKFTDMNAQLNKLPGGAVHTRPGLLPGGAAEPFADGKGTDKFDLVISNIPAKAGGPVIEDFLTGCGQHLSDDGVAAVVIVSSLAEFAGQALTASGATVTLKENDRDYSVFHFIPGKKERPLRRSFHDIYKRNNNKITGFYGLPEFDTVSYQTDLGRKILAKTRCPGPVLFWNPGIGHLPLALLSAADKSDPLPVLAGDDLLQLKAADYNVKIKTAFHHLKTLKDLSEFFPAPSFNSIIANPVFVTGAGIEAELMTAAGKLLNKGGIMIAAGKSSDMSRVESLKKGFEILNSIKYRGYRAILFKKLT